MNLFRNLSPSKNSKKNLDKTFAAYVCAKAKDCGISLKDNNEFLTRIAINNLERINNSNKIKYDSAMIRLWATLDMREYLNSFFELTINPYISELPIKDLEQFFLLPEKYLNLLDIKFIKKINIDDITLNNLYFVSYEIKDKKYNAFRPYVEIYTNSDDEGFLKIGFGYDSNDDTLVELSIDGFNYAITLTPSGLLTFPFSSKKIKLNVYDILDDNKIIKLISNIFVEDIQIS